MQATFVQARYLARRRLCVASGLVCAKDDGQGCHYSTCTDSSGGARVHFDLLEICFKGKQHWIVISIRPD